jgi:ribonuclease BN (tRNA processing enzyme)
MTITFIGTASGVPVPHRRHSCLLVEHAGEAQLFDAGEGAASALAGRSIGAGRITTVWISHTHADHISGLPMLLQGMHLAGRTESLDIRVPPGRELWFENWLHGMYMFREKWSFPFSMQPLSSPATGVGLLVRSIQNRHLDKTRELALRHRVPAQAWSFVLTCGTMRVLLTSDISGIADIAEFTSSVQITILDAAHVPMEEVFLLAERCTALEIICTHIPPELEADLGSLNKRSARDFGGRVLFAHDGMSIAPQCG